MKCEESHSCSILRKIFIGPSLSWEYLLWKNVLKSFDQKPVFALLYVNIFLVLPTFFYNK